MLFEERLVGFEVSLLLNLSLVVVQSTRVGFGFRSWHDVGF